MKWVILSVVTSGLVVTGIIVYLVIDVIRTYKKNKYEDKDEQAR